MTKRICALLGLAVMVEFASCAKETPTAPVAVVTTTTVTTTTTTTTPPAGQACGVPANTECSPPPGGGDCCVQGYDVLGEFVELSIRQVQRERPELFSGDRLRNETDADEVVRLVARTLESRFGLCAKAGDPVDDEVAVKRNNEFSEQYDLIIGNGVGVNIHGYVVTCRPARF